MADHAAGAGPVEGRLVATHDPESGVVSLQDASTIVRRHLAKLLDQVVQGLVCGHWRGIGCELDAHVVERLAELLAL